jgi:hypothetical protein
MLGGDSVLLHQIVGGVGGRGVYRGAETRDEVARVAFVPRRGEQDHRLALGGEPEALVRYAERVEQQQAAAVVDRIRRDLSPPRLFRRPVGMCCLPVPEGRR